MTFVRNDCKLFRFCTSKCHRQFKHKKNPRKARWTKAFRKSAGKELSLDPSFEFEKRRDVPVKYDRELWKESMGAMKRVAMIKQKREAHFIMKRLRKARAIERERDVKEVARDISMIKSGAAGMKHMRHKGRVLVKKEMDGQEEEESEDEEMFESSEEEEALMEAN